MSERENGLLRISICNDGFLPIIDGVSRVAYEYANALGSRGHECYVIAPMADAGYRAQYPFEIVDFTSVILPGPAQYRTGVATLDKHYLNRMATIDLDMIHVHSPGPAGLEAVRLATKRKIPLIGTFHTKYYEDFLRATRSEGLATLGVKYVVEFFDRCDEVWTVSKTAANTLREYGYKGDVEIVPHGIRIPKITQADVRAAKRAYELDDGLPIILYVGQMDWKKNIRLAIEAAGRAYQRGVAFRFVFAGRGQDMEAIQALAGECLPPQCTRFTGHITDQSLLNGLYKCASLFIFPSNYDTAGLVVREAAAAGVPSVVLHESAPSEVISDWENGFICQDDAADLADVMEGALSDMERLRAIGRCAKNTIPVPWEKVMDGVIERYQALVEKGVVKRKRGRFFKKEAETSEGTLEKRTMELMMRLVKQDMQNIYAYEYSPQKREMLDAGQSMRLPRATPEQQGVSSRDVLSLFQNADRDSALGIQAMMVLRHGHVIAEGYWAPYTERQPHQLYSMGKSVVATAIGLLIDEGKLSLHDKLLDIFSDKVDNPDEHPMRAVTIRHLLTMSTGARFNEVGTALGVDWVQEYLDGGVHFEPGEHFAYNSMNTYMLCAVMHRRAGASVMEYLGEKLFAPLGIADANWETCPKGIEKGGWGLSLTLEDVAKIGLLYLQKGRYPVNGEMRQLISEEWVQEATSVQIDTPEGECQDGYGYHIWMAPEGRGFLFNGAFGQHMIALPAQDALVAAFSGTAQLFAEGELMSYVWSSLSHAGDAPLKENKRALRVLENTLPMLNMAGRHTIPAGALMEVPFPWLVGQLGGMSFSFEKNTAGLIPVVLQSVRNNYARGVAKVTFEAEGEDELRIHIFEGKSENTIHLNGTGFTYTDVSVRQDTYEVAAQVRYGMLDNGDILLRVFVYFLETPCIRELTFVVHEGEAALTLDETPSVKDSLNMLMELADITQLQTFRILKPLLKRERMQNRLRSMTTAIIHGKQE